MVSYSQEGADILYDVIFYEDKNGRKEIEEHLLKLREKADGEIWELRPLNNRILYAYYEDNKFILLHHFIKTTRKTPKRELEQAIRNLKDYQERNGE